MDRKRSSTLYLARKLLAPDTGSIGGSEFLSGVEPDEPIAPLTHEKRIGVWDIDVHAGFLHHVLDAVNVAQTFLRFHPIDAVVPTALTLSGNRNKQIMRAAGVRFKDIADNTWAPDLYKVARPVLKQLPIDLLAVTVTPMIMEYEDDGETLGWNYFATSRRGIILVSSFGLRTYAAAAERTPEACLALLVISASLSEINNKVDPHPKTRGCLFDYCENRDDIIESFRSMKFCDDCQRDWTAKRRDGVLKMLEALRNYARPSA